MSPADVARVQSGAAGTRSFIVEATTIQRHGPHSDPHPNPLYGLLYPKGSQEESPKSGSAVAKVGLGGRSGCF